MWKERAALKEKKEKLKLDVGWDSGETSRRTFTARLRSKGGVGIDRKKQQDGEEGRLRIHAKYRACSVWQQCMLGVSGIPEWELGTGQRELWGVAQLVE